MLDQYGNLATASSATFSVGVNGSAAVLGTPSSGYYTAAPSASISLANTVAEPVKVEITSVQTDGIGTASPLVLTFQPGQRIWVQVCVCAGVCVCRCVRADVRAARHCHTYARAHTHTHIHTYTHTHTHIHTYTHTHIHTYTNTQIHTYTHTHTHTYAHTHTHTYAHTHTHTHTRTHLHTRTRTRAHTRSLSNNYSFAHGLTAPSPLSFPLVLAICACLWTTDEIVDVAFRNLPATQSVDEQLLLHLAPVDQFANVVPVNGNITLSTSPIVDTLSSKLRVVDGHAYGALQATVPGTYTLTAELTLASGEAGAAPVVSTASIDMTTGALAGLAFSQTKYTTQVGSPVVIEAQFVDQFGNVIDSVSGSVNVSTNGTSVQGLGASGVVSLTAGRGSFSLGSTVAQTASLFFRSYSTATSPPQQLATDAVSAVVFRPGS